MKTDSGVLEQENMNRGMPFSASLFTVFLTILFGANAVAVKVTLVGVGVYSAAGIRFGLAAIAITLWSIYTGRSLRIDRGQAKSLFVISLLFTVQVALFYHGLNLTTASHGTLIANLLPFVVLVLAHYFIPGEPFTRKKIAGVMLGFIGVLLLVFDKQEAAADVLTGDLLILVAVLFWGTNAVIIKKIITTTHPVLVTLYPMIFAAPCLLLAGYFLDTEMVEYIDLPIFLCFLYQSFVTASFGYIAWNTLVREYGTTIVHSFVYLMPISGVFFGVLLLGEPVTASLVGAIILIVLGIIVVNHKNGSRKSSH